MQKLNLPQFDVKIQESNGKTEIFDALRKKYIVLTPEEWVRQHFVNLLIQHYNYPKSLISLESGLKYNELQKRSDIVVYDREGKPF
ncbi:MAG: type I restriction enzyme HsdR N-terminal domain-containing protein, partial [Cytophagaceae bacterium]